MRQTKNQLNLLNDIVEARGWIEGARAAQKSGEESYSREYAESTVAWEQELRTNMEKLYDAKTAEYRAKMRKELTDRYIRGAMIETRMVEARVGGIIEKALAGGVSYRKIGMALGYESRQKERITRILKKNQE